MWRNGGMFTIDLPAAVLGFVGVHLGLRSEVATIERATAEGDVELAVRRACLLGRVLGHHHHAEDTVLFPALLARQPGFQTSTAVLDAQHDELLRVVPRLAGDLTLAPDVGQLLRTHLAAEEQLVLPVWMASFDGAEHERFAASLRRSTPIRDAGLMVSRLLDTAPDEATGLAWDQVPPALRLVHRLWWRRRYDREYGTASSIDQARPEVVFGGLGGAALAA